MVSQEQEQWVRDVPFDLDDFREQFVNLEAPRSHIKQLQPLTSILTIAVKAILAGSTGPTSIVRWTQQKADWLATPPP